MARGLHRAMRARGLGFDLQLAREGLLLGWHFGARSVGELARIASYIESSVYDRGSLSRWEDGIRFRLTNPPLRLGAFDRASLWVNGQVVPGDHIATWGDEGHERRLLSEISGARPLALLPGHPTHFQVRLEPPPAWGTRLVVRLELHNIAIPPPVWLQFRDRVGRGNAR
jgi:hypothetical protein